MDTELLLLGFIVLHMILDGAGVCARFVSFILFVVREASVDGLFSFSFFFFFHSSKLGRACRCEERDINNCYEKGQRVCSVLKGASFGVDALFFLFLFFSFSL